MRDQTLAIKIRADAAQAKGELERMADSLKRIGHYGAAFLLGGGLIQGVRNLGNAIQDAAAKFTAIESALKFSAGGAALAAQEYQFIRQETYRLGLDLERTARAYTKLAASARGTSLEGEHARQIFSAVSEAVTVMGLSAQEADGALLAISQMMSKGKVSAEELHGQLGERLPGALSIAARAMGTTTAEFSAMLDRGEVLAEEFLPKFAAEMRRTFADAVPSATNTARAAIARMGSAWDEFKMQASAAFAEAVNGVSDLNGELDQLGKNRKIQEWAKSAAIALAFLAEQIVLVKRLLETAGSGYIALGETLRNWMAQDALSTAEKMGMDPKRIAEARKRSEEQARMAAGFAREMVDNLNRSPGMMDAVNKFFAEQERLMGLSADQARAEGFRKLLDKRYQQYENELRGEKNQARKDKLLELYRKDVADLIDQFYGRRNPSPASAGAKERGDKDEFAKYIKDSFASRMRAFDELKDKALRIKDKIKRDDVLTGLIEAFFRPEFEAAEAEERWNAEVRRHDERRLNEIATLRQEYARALRDMLGETGEKAQQLWESLTLDEPAQRRAADRRYVQGLRDTLDGIRAMIGESIDTSALDAGISAIERYLDAAGRIRDAQAGIDAAMEQRSARLQEIQALVTAGSMTEVDARHAAAAAARETLTVLDAHMQQLRMLAEQGYPAARIELDKWRAVMVELKDQASDKTWVDGIVQGMKDYAGAFNDVFGTVRDAAKNAFKSMEDALVNLVRTGKLDFRSMADSIISDLIRIQIQGSITKPLAAALSGINLGSAMRAILPFASGGVPGGASITAWRNQIVDRPTFFTFARGGIMGEAGPEAIMPLRRMPSGNLGVEASVAPVTINIHNHTQAQVRAQSVDGPQGRRIEIDIDTVDAALADNLRRGRGPLAGTLAGLYGVNRAYGAV